MDRRIQLEDAPISRNAIILYTWMLGHFPQEGPHALLDEGYLARHLQRVRRDVRRYVPEGFDGPVVIDYEPWWPLVEWTRNEPSKAGPEAKDHDYLDDMEEAMLRTGLLDPTWNETERDIAVEAKYEELARTIYLSTIRLCRELRPRAQWGFFNLPPKRYVSSYTPPGTIGYPTSRDSAASRQNDEVFAWLLDEVDALYPAPYALRETVALPRRDRDVSFQDTVRQNRIYVHSNVAEAVHLARGKPVLPVIGLRYQLPERRGRFLRPINLLHTIRIPREAGASGVLLWGPIDNEREHRDWQEYVHETLLPILDWAL